MKKTNVLLLMIIFTAVLMVSCKPVSNPDNNVLSGDENLQATQELKKFNNAEELKTFLEARAVSAGYTSSNYRFFGAASGLKTLSATESLAAPQAMSEDGASYDSSSSATDYSETNVQVEGVDEADFVKNDGRYIYMIAENKVLIIDAFDAENAKILYTIRIADDADSKSEDYWYSPTARELFVNGNKLAVFVETNEKTFYFEKYDIVPRETYKQKTLVYIYDISNREKPELKETFSFSGSYFKSRMIGNVVYLISQDNIDYYRISPPVIYDMEGAKVMQPDVYYFDNPDEEYQYNTISSIDLNKEEVVDSKSFLLGYSNTVMVSEDNIYIAYQKQNYWPCRFRCLLSYSSSDMYERERFFEVVVPLLKGDIKNNVQSIINKNLDEKEEWSQISDALSEFYKEVSEDEDKQDEYEDMLENIQKALVQYDLKKELEERKTVIHKISVDDGKIDYDSKGEVYGSLLNQFSLDEYDGYLRVATTVTAWLNEQIQYNNVYVLNSAMKVVGKVEEIAKDERIYSTRFLGDKLYMVTFRQVDPFFVIDLSNPEKPEVLGKLKIPGYSDYLHPYDENHIIGIGKETETNEYGGVITKGLKVALFDVSDFENPELVDSYIIGDRGTDSPALHDHRAFLFSKTKNILVLPITEVTEKTTLSEYRYDYKIWHGAYVFDVDETGFTLKGKVRHTSSTSSYFDWWNQASVMRSLYMDKNLYTISNKYIKINDLSNDLAELNAIDLPYSENRPYYYG